MTKICVINGSPRKNFNTAEMCSSFLDGAKSVNSNIETKMFNIYDYNYKGCVSCLGCKLMNGKSYGKCVKKDDITDIIEEVSNSDGVVFASPIYFSDITGELRSFMERLLFPYLTYEEGLKPIAPKKLQTAFIYTMNVKEEDFKNLEYEKVVGKIEWFVGHIFTPPERICAFNTYQVKNYSIYNMGIFSESEKSEYKSKYWKEDLRKAFDAGKRMAEKFN